MHAARRAAVVAPLIWLLALGRTATAGTVGNAAPYWYRDDYLDTSGANLAASTTTVDTSAPGTVRLPYAPAEAAFDPGGTYALVAHEGGVDAYVFDGQHVQPLPTWDLSGLAATGVAWLHGGDAIAVSTADQVIVYGLSPQGTADLVARAPVTGATGVAPGPASLPFAVLVASSTGARLFSVQGTELVSLAGGPAGLTGNRGVAGARDGALVATWQDEAIQIWAWDGGAYRRARAWDPPAPPLAAGPVVGVAFFPQGGGYWELTRQGQLLAYAVGPDGVSALSGWSLSLPLLPMAVAAGWGPGAVAALYPTGWDYADLGGGGAVGLDSPRSLSGQTWPAYLTRAVMQSVSLPVGHTVTQVRVEDADCAAGRTPPDCARPPAVPASTTVAYDVSTDGCRTWTAAPSFTAVEVPAGRSLCYRLTLTSADPRVTPVVDVTDLYEIGWQRTAEAVAALLCAAGTC